MLYAACYGSGNGLAWLIQHGAQVNEKHNSLFLSLVEVKQPILARLLRTEDTKEIVHTILWMSSNAQEIWQATFTMIALGRNDAVIAIFNVLGYLITPEIIKDALEVAAACNNLFMVEELYKRAINLPGINQEQLANTLYWAAIGRSEEIVDFILEQAFIYGRVPNLIYREFVS